MKSWIKLLPIASLAIILAGCADATKPPTGDADSTGMLNDDIVNPELQNSMGSPEIHRVSLTAEDAVWNQFPPIHFDYDSATIRTEDRKTLEDLAAWLKENSSRQVLIAGNCDKRGTLEYNRSLGQRRASAARDYLVKLGASASNIGTVSYGEEKPAAQGDDDSSYAENRRDDFGVSK